MTEVLATNRRSMLALVFEGFLSRFGFGIISFALPLYAYSLGMSMAAIGLLISLNLGVSALCKPMLAKIVDRIGYRRAAIISTIMRVAILALFLLASTPWVLFAIQVLRGLSKGMRDPALYALIASHGGSRSLASAFAWYGTAKSVATSLGKALAGVMLGFWVGAYSLVFAFALIPAMLPILLLLRSVDEVVVPKGASIETFETDTDENFSTDTDKAFKTNTDENFGTRKERTMNIIRDLGPLIGFGFCVSATGRMLRGLLPILAVEYAGMSVTAAGGLYLVSAVVMLISGPVFGWLSDNISRRLVLSVRGIANTLSSLLYAVMPTPLGFNIAKAVDTLGSAAFKPTWGALMAESALARGENRARVMAVMGAGRDAGAIVGPLIGGTLWTLFGPVPLLLTRAALSIGTEVYAFVIGQSWSASLNDNSRKHS